MLKQFSPVISFLAFFFALTCFLDLAIPNKGELVHIVKKYNGKFEEITTENDAQLFKRHNKGQFIWRESTRILHQPMRYFTISKNIIKEHDSTFNFYIPGIVFVFFLAIGGIYGVFFKKSKYQEKKLLYYNLLVSLFLLIMYISSAENVV